MSFWDNVKKFAQPYADDDYDDYDEDDEYLDEDYEEEGFDFGDEDSTIYEVVCPVCDEIVNFDEETLEKGSIVCPDCGEVLEFSLDDEDEDEE